MKKTFTLLVLVIAYSLNAQTTDYNTEKGFIAVGYDVVSYFSNTAKEGINKYVSTHDGIKFKFSSQTNLDIFNLNPTKYVPQYGGYCAYALAVKNKKVSVDPETFEIRNGKLYLFYNFWGSNALESWLDESPDVLKLKADENWKKLN
jgi:YHS domain-containing protein